MNMLTDVKNCVVLFKKKNHPIISNGFRDIGTLSIIARYRAHQSP